MIFIICGVPLLYLYLEMLNGLWIWFKWQEFSTDSYCAYVYMCTIITLLPYPINEVTVHSDQDPKHGQRFIIDIRSEST